jgi:hypothetical protein
MLCFHEIALLLKEKPWISYSAAQYRVRSSRTRSSERKVAQLCRWSVIIFLSLRRGPLRHRIVVAPICSSHPDDLSGPFFVSTALLAGNVSVRTSRPSSSRLVPVTISFACGRYSATRAQVGEPWHDRLMLPANSLQG